MIEDSSPGTMQRQKVFFLFTLSVIVSFLSAADFPGSGDHGHHRVRRFIFTKNSKVSFDFNFLRPVPIMGQMDVMGIVEVPVSVTMDNDTFNWTPVSLPYFVMSGPPAPLPMPMFPSVFHSPEEALRHVPNHSYYVHKMVRRQASLVSSQHRRDIFRGIVTSLEEFGIDGTACVCRFICQLSHAPLLIETPLHEVLEHILSVSKGFDDQDPEMDAFRDAEQVGKSEHNCLEKYATCGFDLFALEDQTSQEKR